MANVKLFEESTVNQWEVIAASGKWSFRGIVSDFFNGVSNEAEVKAYIQRKAPAKLDSITIKAVTR